MPQTFQKTINGHGMQFNRLLFPVRYAIKLEEYEYYGIIIPFVKDDVGDWKIEKVGGIPGWFYDMYSNIKDVVDINECYFEK